jgi:hypothetical protein
MESRRARLLRFLHLFLAMLLNDLLKVKWSMRLRATHCLRKA